MAATLDFKNPTVVIVGHWNAAILNEPGWIARHILGIPAGQQIDLQAVVVGSQVSPGQIAPEKQIWLFDEFGMNCSGQRLEFFTRDIDNLQPLYSAVAAVAEKLPHTPVKAVGVNLNFQISGDLAATTPLFDTNETFDTLGAIMSQDRVERIKIPDDHLLEIADFPNPHTILNLTRKTDFDTAEINFNYHLNLSVLNLLVNWSQAEPISYWRQHALRVMSDCYGFDEVETTYF